MPPDQLKTFAYVTEQKAWDQAMKIAKDVIAGRVDMIFDNIPQGLASAREGKVRALAVTGKERSPQAPEIPTMAEFLSVDPDWLTTGDPAKAPSWWRVPTSALAVWRRKNREQPDPPASAPCAVHRRWRYLACVESGQAPAFRYAIIDPKHQPERGDLVLLAGHDGDRLRRVGSTLLDTIALRSIDAQRTTECHPVPLANAVAVMGFWFPDPAGVVRAPSAETTTAAFRMQAAMKARRMTMSQLAEATGISSEKLRHLRDRRSVRSGHYLAIAAALDVDLVWLMAGLQATAPAWYTPPRPPVIIGPSVDPEELPEAWRIHLHDPRDPESVVSRLPLLLDRHEQVQEGDFVQIRNASVSCRGHVLSVTGDMVRYLPVRGPRNRRPSTTHATTVSRIVGYLLRLHSTAAQRASIAAGRADPDAPRLTFERPSPSTIPTPAAPADPGPTPLAHTQPDPGREPPPEFQEAPPAAAPEFQEAPPPAVPEFQTAPECLAMAAAIC